MKTITVNKQKYICYFVDDDPNTIIQKNDCYLLWGTCHKERILCKDRPYSKWVGKTILERNEDFSTVIGIARKI